jgi:hypothetical protein
MTHININFFDHEDALFDSNDAYMNAPQYGVICTIPVLSYTKR